MLYDHIFFQRIIRYKENGILTLLFNILIEFLFIGYIGFIALFGIETILPLFITSHISLTKLFIILSLLSFCTIFIGHIIEQDFDIRFNKKNPILWIGLFFLLGILLLSILRFPLGTLPFILTAFFILLWIIWNIFFTENEEIF